MDHRYTEIALALQANHGISATVTKLARNSAGDNELFLASPRHVPASVTEFPDALVVRAMCGPDQADRLSRLLLVHEWAGQDSFPALSVLGSGSLQDGTAYLLLPYVKQPAERFHLLVRQLPRTLRELVDLQTQLHERDGTHWPGPRRGVEGVVREIADAASQYNSRGAEPIVEWLMSHQADAEGDDDEVVCHLDLHPSNILLPSSGDVFVIDWDTAAMAPRAADVGITAELLTLGAVVGRPWPLGPAALFGGARVASVYVRHYSDRHRVEPRAVHFWRVVHAVHVLLWERGATLLGSAIRTPERRSDGDDPTLLHRLRQLTQGS